MNRRGFTLLEVMLALALASLVLMAVAMAIDIHLRLLDSGRTKVEEAQLARTLLRRIADDLRSAVQPNPIKADELMPQMKVSTEAARELTGDADFDMEDLDDAGTDDLTESYVLPSVPGIYGNRYELQVDTARLPRLDQYNGMSTDDDFSAADLVSDVKTVLYYVSEDESGGVTYTGDVSLQTGGLIRYERDRATAAWANDQATLTEAEYDLEPIAPEVAAIEFRYFDGTEWLDEWDSAEEDGLPMAVEIAIGIIPVPSRKRETASLRPSTSSTATDDELLVYRLLVHLPVAQPTDEEETSEEMSEEPSEETSDETSEESTPGSSDGPSSGGGSRR